MRHKVVQKPTLGEKKKGVKKYGREKLKQGAGIWNIRGDEGVGDEKNES